MSVNATADGITVGFHLCTWKDCIMLKLVINCDLRFILWLSVGFVCVCVCVCLYASMSMCVCAAVQTAQPNTVDSLCSNTNIIGF